MCLIYCRLLVFAPIFPISLSLSLQLFSCNTPVCLLLSSSQWAKFGSFPLIKLTDSSSSTLFLLKILSLKRPLRACRVLQPSSHCRKGVQFFRLPSSVLALNSLLLSSTLSCSWCNLSILVQRINVLSLFCSKEFQRLTLF